MVPFVGAFLVTFAFVLAAGFFSSAAVFAAAPFFAGAGFGSASAVFFTYLTPAMAVIEL